MGLLNALTGEVTLEVTSADTAGFLTAAGLSQITLFNVVHINDLTIQCTVQRTKYRHCIALAERRGDKIRILRRNGIYWKLKLMRYRPMLFVGVLLFLFAVFYLPSRVFFVRVEGNNAISSKKILEQAESCGIYFGASRREVRSEKVKNALLYKIPELQWAGVNTSGCVATISVREKSTIKETSEQTHGVSSIVAIRDGVIRECTVLKGNALCQIGQAVRTGEILVSGYTDCGISIQATQAKAEIFAQTLRDLTVITPVDAAIRREITEKQVQYSLQIGKKLIKFYKDSGISDVTCVKMYTKKNVTLPGSFQLPVAWITEEVTYYKTFPEETKEDTVFAWMETYAQTYLNTQMIAGRILDSNLQLNRLPGVVCMDGRYTCFEMIGQVREEEIIKPNG